MIISVNTETEKIEELKHSLSIIENAIRRRENSNHHEEKMAVLVEELKEQQVKLEPEKLAVMEEAPKVEEPKPQIEINLTRPTSYVQVQQVHQAEKPKPMPSNMGERGSAKDIDISALSTSNYGESKEGRKLDGQNSSSSSSSSYPSSNSPQPRGFEPRGVEPRGFEPRVNPSNNKTLVKEIISSIRTQRPGQSIQVTDIIGKARGRNISEQETRNLISQLQKEGSI